MVAGAGSWGTALAMVLASNNRQVVLWDKIKTHIEHIKKDRINQKYLPGYPLDDHIQPEVDFITAFQQTGDIIVAVPSHALRSVLQQIPDKEPARKICIATKGLEQGTQKFAHQIVEDCLGTLDTVAILSGPSFAKEVVKRLPTAVAIASTCPDIADHFAVLFHNEKFRIYTHDDIIGIEVGGAVKNIMAIAAGIADGLGFGANTRAALITRGLAEIIRLGDALGADRTTFMGLAGLGDLVLTCTDDLSRNRRMGLALAKHISIQQAKEEIGQEVEGIQTTLEIYALANKLGIEMPITEQVYQVLTGKTTPDDAVRHLLSRNMKTESI